MLHLHSESFVLYTHMNTLIYVLIRWAYDGQQKEDMRFGRDHSICLCSETVVCNSGGPAVDETAGLASLVDG